MAHEKIDTEQKREVRIHIDQKPYDSPNPTTGAALYKLAHVQANFELFREIGGDKEDPAVPDDQETIHLKQDEHFHSGPTRPKKFVIVVNGQQKTVTTTTVTFEEIVKLAFPNPPTGQNILFTVGYEDGPHANPAGSLLAGGKVKVKDGMIFNVTPTDKS
jgi:hypothetical protein